MTETLSMQLYSCRNFPPLQERLQTLARLGYGNVEPFRGLYGDVDGLKSALDAAGLTARSGHFSVDLLEQDYEGSLTIARALKIEIVVVPFLDPARRPGDSAGWAAFGKRVSDLAGRLKGDGLRLAWHNHDFEMAALADGSRPIEHILGDDPAVEWEVDVAWVAVAGEDPESWMRRYAGRIAALHVKDIAPAGEKCDEDGWADVGDGTLDWAKLWRVGREAGAALMIAEHDNPSDFERFARRSIKAMQAYGAGN